MFPKTLTTFKILNPEVFAADKFTEESLAELAHKPIASTASISTGWAKVRDDLYQFRYMNLIRLDFLIEKKSVPASAIKRALAARSKAIADERGHAPGRKELKELKQEVKEELLARAVASDATTKVWVDLQQGTLSIESTSTAVVDAVMRALYVGHELQAQNLKWPGNEAMTIWLASTDEDAGIPEDLTADDFVTLEHPGESGKSVRYDRANLDDDDVKLNFELGATVTQLALTWADKLSFVLSGKAGQLNKIKATDVLKGNSKEKDVDAYQNDVYLVGTTIRELNNYLTAQA